MMNFFGGLVGEDKERAALDKILQDLKKLTQQAVFTILVSISISS